MHTHVIAAAILSLSTVGLAATYTVDFDAASDLDDFNLPTAGANAYSVGGGKLNAPTDATTGNGPVGYYTANIFRLDNDADAIDVSIKWVWSGGNASVAAPTLQLGISDASIGAMDFLMTIYRNSSGNRNHRLRYNNSSTSQTSAVNLPTSATNYTFSARFERVSSTQLSISADAGFTSLAPATFTVPAGFFDSDIYVGLAADADNLTTASLPLDDFTVTGVPEPASLALLGLAAGALVRRRRA